jgi:hypothetical protein
MTFEGVAEHGLIATLSTLASGGVAATAWDGTATMKLALESPARSRAFRSVARDEFNSGIAGQRKQSRLN